MASTSLTSPASPSSQEDRELIDDLVRTCLDKVISLQQQNGRTPGSHSLATWRSQQQHRQSNGISPLSVELRCAVLALTEEYQRLYSDKLEQLCANWIIDSDCPQDSFKQVLDNIFMDGCNWGRFVTIFVFASMFLRHCQQQRGQVLVSSTDVRQWSVDYIATKVLPWIKENGGWLGLIRFYKDGDPAARREEGNSRLTQLLTVAGAGLALMGLTSFLVNRA